jgi:hypothetical protein
MEAQGTFPGLEVVLGNFAALFESSEKATEQPADILNAFLLGLDQLSNVAPSIEPALGARLYQWSVDNWATSPVPFLKKLCALLVNVATPESLQFMKDERDKTNDELVKKILTESILDHRISRAEAKAKVESVGAAAVALATGGHER